MELPIGVKRHPGKLNMGIAIDQEQLVSVGTAVINGAGLQEKAAQSFQVSAGGITCPKIEPHIFKNGGPVDNIVLRIETNNAGEPSGVLVHANATKSIGGASIGGGAAYVAFEFPTSITLAAGTLYWIVLQRSGGRDEVNRYRWKDDNAGNNYPNGQKGISNTGVWQIGPWALYDMTFKVYKDTLDSSAISMGANF